MWGTGRVKTLHPGVHGGILARRDLPEHLDAVGKHNISLIDVVRIQITLKHPLHTAFASSKPESVQCWHAYPAPAASSSGLFNAPFLQYISAKKCEINR